MAVPLAIGAAAIAALYAGKRYFQGPKCHSTKRLEGKTVVITGGNTGIGKETAVDLAKRGAKVIVGCRKPGERDSSTKGDTRAKWKLKRLPREVRPGLFRFSPHVR